MVAKFKQLNLVVRTSGKSLRCCGRLCGTVRRYTLSGMDRNAVRSEEGDLEKIWLKAKARHPTHRVGSAMPAAAIICWAPAFPAVYRHFYG